MNRGRRNLIIALSVLAGVLVCGIVVAAASAARSSYDAKMAEYQGQADKFSADQKALEEENADLKRQLKNVSAEGQRQADRLAAAEREVGRAAKRPGRGAERGGRSGQEVCRDRHNRRRGDRGGARTMRQKHTEAPAVVQDAGGGGNAVVDQAPAVTVVKVQHAKTNATRTPRRRPRKAAATGVVPRRVIRFFAGPIVLSIMFASRLPFAPREQHLSRKGNIFSTPEIKAGN